MASNSKLTWALALFLFLFPLLIEARSTPHSHQPFEFIKKLEGCHKGQTIKGLHQLKHYLEKFGYLPHHSTTTTKNNNEDSFDDLLESAIKSYQLNHHLNLTGELDTATAQQMMRPRCGVPDHVNGKMSKDRHLGSTPVSHFSFFPGEPKWPPSKSHLTYGFLPGVQVIEIQNLRSICASAFAKWQSVSHFTFQETQNVDSADLKIGFFRGNHNDGHPFDGMKGVLAHAFAPQRGWFHFDADERWGINPSGDAVDVESVAVHEIGHLLGLGHSTDRNAIMYDTYTYGERKVNLAADDIQGIQTLYNL